MEAINGSGQSHKHDDLGSVGDLIRDCGRYVNKVVELESAITTARYYMDPEEYREHIMRLDSNRSHAHNALIASVRVLNRLCRAYQVAPIYVGPDERIPVAEFAMEVVAEMFQERKL